MRALDKHSWLFWLSVMAVIVLLGEGALGYLASQAVSLAEPRYAIDYAFGLQLPVRVVNDVPSGWDLLAVFWVFVAAMAITGWLLARAASADANVSSAKLLAGMAAIGLLLTFFPITFAGDPYAYVAFGRMYALYGINPYHVTGPIDVRSDLILAQCLRFYGNPPVGDNYGPLWTLLAGAVAWITQGLPLVGQVWSERVVALGAVIVAAAGVHKLVASRFTNSSKRAFALFAFHPTVVYEAAAGAHNDTIMLAFAVWAFAMVDAFPLYAGALLGAACAVKYVAVVAIPFLFLRTWKTSGAASAILGLFTAAAVAVISFAPFWIGPSTLGSLFAETASTRTSPTFLADVLLGAFQFDRTGIAGMTVSSFVSIAVAVALAIIVVWSIVRYARGLDGRDVWRSIAAFIYALPSIYPWYTLWLAPAIAKAGRWGAFAYWLSLLSFLHYAQDAPRQPSGISYVHAFEGIVVLTILALGLPVVLARRLALDRADAGVGG
ncbi:MAG TPA: glycosyltransferase 87 family protein [Candidatus Eremiobacteraceae bacterium]|jgi:hypothetical protein